LVADGASEAVLDRLEAIEIQHSKAKGDGEALSRQTLELACQVATVVQSGQPVALRLVAELRLEPFERAAATLELGCPARAS
jgi:hypothetical protein